MSRKHWCVGGFWNLRCLTSEYLDRTMFKRPGYLKIRYTEPWFWAFNIVSRFDRWPHLQELWRDWPKRWLHPKNRICLTVNRSYKQSPYLVFWKAVIGICIYCHRSDHDGELSNTPAHDESSDSQVILDGCTKDYKSNYVQRQSDTAGPNPTSSNLRRNG